MKKILLTVVLICLVLSLASCQSEKEADLFAFSFDFDGISVTLPEKIGTFTDSGYSFPEKFNKTPKTVKVGNLESTYLEKGENWFNVELVNNTEADIALTDCVVGRFTYDFSGDAKITLSDGFELSGKTVDDFIKRYGEPYSQKDYPMYTEIIYDKNPEESIYDRYTFRFDLDTKVINYVDAINFER